LLCYGFLSRQERHKLINTSAHVASRNTFRSLAGNTWPAKHCSDDRALDDGQSQAIEFEGEDRRIMRPTIEGAVNIQTNKTRAVP
jgi:hypothetical protein